MNLREGNGISKPHEGFIGFRLVTAATVDSPSTPKDTMLQHESSSTSQMIGSLGQNPQV